MIGIVNLERLIIELSYEVNCDVSFAGSIQSSNSPDTHFSLKVKVM